MILLYLATTAAYQIEIHNGRSHTPHIDLLKFKVFFLEKILHYLSIRGFRQVNTMFGAFGDTCVFLILCRYLVYLQ